VDIQLTEAEPRDDERAAVDALLGPPRSQWEGGERIDPREGHLGHTGAAVRARRHLLLPTLQAIQSRIGWISEGALDYVCERLNVPQADAWGVATFYALLSTTPRPRGVLHVCDDIACKTRGADRICAALTKEIGPAHAHGPAGDHVAVDPNAMTWLRSPCLGMCDQAPAALIQVAQPGGAFEALVGDMNPARAIDAVKSSTAALKGFGADGGGTGMRSDSTVRGLTLLHESWALDPTSNTVRRTPKASALSTAIEMGPEAVIKEVTDSKLMGRGGAAFPTGRKWVQRRRIGAGHIQGPRVARARRVGDRRSDDHRRVRDRV
jgi:NADH-quinone oxidoreductase subunit F